MNKSKKIKGIEQRRQFRIEQITKWVIPEI